MTIGQRIRSFIVKSAGILALAISLSALVLLLWDIFSKGYGSFTWEFLTSFPSRFAARAGIKSAFFGTVWVMALVSVISIPIGVLTGIYLEEFSTSNWFTRAIRINIANLAGVPSVVYGMLGLAIFVRAFSLGRSVLAGALTMSLLILPTIVIATSEALKAVPDTIRLGAFGVGATRRQVVWSHVLPEALPGISTGIILALSRAIGESAPLILIGALSFVAFVPEGPMDSFTVLAIQIFNWAGRPQPEFHAIAASAIVVLLAIVLGMNSLAIFLRTRISKKRVSRR